MTLAVAFRCEDGILIGADSETWYGNAKVYQEKVFVIPEHKQKDGDYGVVLTGAGDFAVMSHCAQLLREKYLSRCDGALLSIQQSLRTFATSKDYREVVERQSGPSGVLTEFIVAIRSVDCQTDLFHLRGLDYYPVQEYIAVGIGSEMAIFFSRWLYRPEATITIFAPLALQIVRAAKGHNPGVGGNTSIYKLFNAGHGASEPLTSVSNDAEFLWGLHDMFRQVIGCCVQTEIPDKYFRDVMDKFSQRVSEVRDSFQASSRTMSSTDQR